MIVRTKLMFRLFRQQAAWSLGIMLLFLSLAVSAQGSERLLSDENRQLPGATYFKLSVTPPESTAELTPTETDLPPVTATLVSTDTPAVTETPVLTETPISTAVPQQLELLLNGGFEIDTNGDFVPDNWERRNAKEDIRRCNKPGVPSISFEGECHFQFKGSPGENSRLAQNIDLAVFDLNPGDTITLSGYFWSKGEVKLWVRTFVTYNDGREEKIVIDFTSESDVYVPFNSSLTLTGQPARVRVAIRSQSPSGRIRVDAVSLIRGDHTQLLPLP